MAIDLARIREILHSGDFDLLIGEFESLQLECKKQPYQLKFEGQKLELAKDVTALANAEGGVILIGYITEKDPTHGEDRIAACHPLKREIFDAVQHSQTIQDWIWPTLRNVEVEWHPSRSDPEKGVGAIFVPKATDADKPVLVAKTMVDNERRVDIVFGYCERGQSRVFHYDVQRIQNLLRDGSRLDQEIREGLQSLHAAIETLRVAHPPESTPSRDPEEINRLSDEALEAVHLSDSPAYGLIATPRRSIDLHQLFESRNSRLVTLLEEPPELRRSGFDITSGNRSRIVEGRLRRVSVDELKLLELHRDGLLIFMARGDDSGLSWSGESRKNKRLINQLYLIETTYLFCKLAYLVYESHLNEGEDFDLELKILRLTFATGKARLESGILGGGLGGYEEAPSDSESFRITVQYGRETAARAAFRLVARVYAWFGYDEDRIPYSATSEEGRTISEELIRDVDNR